MNIDKAIVDLGTAIDLIKKLESENQALTKTMDMLVHACNLGRMSGDGVPEHMLQQASDLLLKFRNKS